MKDQAGGPNPTLPYCLLRTGIAKKIAKQADGGVGYQVLSDRERQALFIRITSNSGGYFSRELVSVEKITACLSQVAKDATFPTKQLRPDFVGKSTCNAGFLLATLKDMELVNAGPAIDGQYAATNDAGWIAWKKSMLAEVGEMIDIEMPSGGPTPLAGNQEQGSIDYASALYQDMLARHGFVCSMSRKGNCWDNSVAERFFLNLKMERVWQRQYANHAEAKADITDYIVGFYNCKRINSVLGNLPPTVYERKMAAREPIVVSGIT